MNEKRDVPRGYAEKWRKREAEFIAEMRKADPEFCREARIGYLVDRISEHKMRIDMGRFAWEQDLKNKTPVMEQMVKWYLSAVPYHEKKLRQYYNEFIMLMQGKEYKNGVSPEMVELARQVPIENFADVDKAGFTNCINPEHSDVHPSMLVKNRFAYCFACQFYCRDVIDFVMKLEDLTFPEAVRFIVESGRE